MQKNFSKIVYGLRPIIENINAGNAISKIFINRAKKDNNSSKLYKELFDLIKLNNIPISMVPIEKLNRLTRENHQGVVAYISPIHFAKIQNIIQGCYEKAKDPTILVLDNITDTRNVGAIIRTASCTDVDAIIIPHYGGALISSDMMKVSAGALANLPLCREYDLLKTLQYLKDSGLELIAMSEKSNKNIYDVDLKKPLAIILGSEDKGIKDTNLKICDHRVKIPITGPILSLNVAVAAGIACYEICRQKML